MAAGTYLIAIALVLGGIALHLVSTSKRQVSTDPRSVQRRAAPRGRLQLLAAGMVIVGVLIALVETVIVKVS